MANWARIEIGSDKIFIERNYCGTGYCPNCSNRTIIKEVVVEHSFLGIFKWETMEEKEVRKYPDGVPQYQTKEIRN